MKIFAGIITIIFLLSACCAFADTLYLKNGESLKGFIKKETPRHVDFDLGYGTVRFYRQEIEKVYRSNQEESEEIRLRWEEEKSASNNREAQFKEQRERYSQVMAEKKKETITAPVEILGGKQDGRINVEVVINDKIKATLVLDTGSSLVVLSKKFAGELGLGFNAEKDAIEMELADGQKVKACRVILASVKVESAVAQEVGAAVLLEEEKVPSFNDGLLGMSFLERFHFSVDPAKGKLILSKPE